MMDYFFLFLCCHLLGDFYGQTERMAKNKTGNVGVTFYHCLIYSLPFLAALLLPNQLKQWEIWIGLIICHWLIDMVKVIIESNYHLKHKRIVYIIDQACHLISISMIAYWYQPIQIELPHLLIKAIPYGLYFLLIMKPTNVTFKIVFDKYQYSPASQLKNEPNYVIKEKELPTTVAGAGALIGDFERLIMGMLLFQQQFSAIGLILTAKSITRYNKISTDPAFSEYYLIGTLYSVLVTIGLYLLIFIY
ncbi:MAG: DUF3307 domain-containing protein [Vagococcus sp.]